MNDTNFAELIKALQFCVALAEEEYPHQQHGNLGAELVLRHIIRKGHEALAKVDSILEQK